MNSFFHLTDRLKNVFALSFFFSLFLFLPGCWFTKEKPMVENFYTEDIRYVFDKQVEKSDRFLFEFPLNHPQHLPQRVIDDMMLSMRYSVETSFLNFFSDKSGMVFSPQTVQDIAPQFRRVFSELEPDEKLVFTIIDEDGDRTSGEAFAVYNSIHWRFNYIKGLSYIKKQTTITDWLSPWTEEDENFHLLIGPNQWYHLTGKTFPRAGNRNWIILPLPGKTLTKKEDIKEDYLLRLNKIKQIHERKKILTNKLMMLEIQLKEGTIPYEVYKKKRQNILDAL